MSRHKGYEYFSPTLGKVLGDVLAPYDPVEAAKQIAKYCDDGWEFLQIYSVQDPANDFGGRILRATVYGLFRREKT